jgi:hypothetical protein
VRADDRISARLLGRDGWPGGPAAVDRSGALVELARRYSAGGGSRARSLRSIGAATANATATATAKNVTRENSRMPHVTNCPSSGKNVTRGESTATHVTKASLGRCLGGPWRAPRQPRRGRSTSSSSTGGLGNAVDRRKQAGLGPHAEILQLAGLRPVPVRTIISSAESLVRQPSAIGRPTVSASRSAGSSFEYLASGSAPAPSSALLKKARAAAARTTSRISASVSAKSLSRSISA